MLCADLQNYILSFILVDQEIYRQFILVSKWYKQHVKLMCIHHITQQMWNKCYKQWIVLQPKYLLCTEQVITLHHLEDFHPIESLSLHTHGNLPISFPLRRLELRFQHTCETCNENKQLRWLNYIVCDQLTHLACTQLPWNLLYLRQLKTVDLRNFTHTYIELDIKHFPSLHTLYYYACSIGWQGIGHQVTTCYIGYTGIYKRVVIEDVFPHLERLCLYNYPEATLNISGLKKLRYLELREGAKIRSIVKPPLLDCIVHNELYAFPGVKNQLPITPFCKPILFDQVEGKHSGQKRKHEAF